MGSTRAERADVTRRKILDAAVQLFLDQHYDDVSVHDLATAAGVSYGLVAHHFGNKRGIHREAIRQIAAQLEQRPPPPGPPGERLRTLVAGHLASARDNPPAYLGLMLATDADTRALVDAGTTLAAHSVAEILDLDLDRPVVRLVLRAWVDATSEATVAWLQDGSRLPVDDLAEWLLAALAAMLRGAVRLDADLEPGLALEALEDLPGA
ncbi:MAG: TetR/AcrR family transcriptional regulator [Candidatus Nanopelagicales bacterium]